MVGSISRKLLTELGRRTEDAECKLMGDIYIIYFVNLVLIIKVVWVITIQRQAIDTPVIKMTSKIIFLTCATNVLQNASTFVSHCWDECDLSQFVVSHEVTLVTRWCPEGKVQICFGFATGSHVSLIYSQEMYKRCFMFIWTNLIMPLLIHFS